MKNIIFISILCLLVINLSFYLSIKYNIFFTLVLINVFFFLNLLIIIMVKKIEKVIGNNTKVNNDKKEVETADDHPIIKSARKRLGK